MPVGGALFRLLSARMAWLGQRQGVLAQNIANADTPGYVPRDLDGAAFARVAERYAARGPGAPPGVAAPAPLAPARTDPAHRPGSAPPARPEPVGRRQRATFEVAPNGNAVVLEEQMANMAQTALDHRLAADLYRKYVGMIRVALDGPA